MADMLGVDIGTTSTKVVRFNEAGITIAKANHGYSLIQTTPGMAEEDPQAIFQAVIAGIREVVGQGGSEIAGVSFSAAMHSLLLLDAEHQPLTGVITWADNRAAGACAQLKRRPDAGEIFARTGVPLHPMTPLAKLLWLQADHPELFASARYFCGIKSYIFYRLFGELAADRSLANATGLFSLKDLDWDDRLLALAQVKRHQLPALVEPTHIFTSLKPQMAAALGISPKTPFVIGASDGCLSNLGAGAITPGSMALTIGTSGAVRAAVDRPRTDPKGRLFTYYLAPHCYVVGGPVNNGAIIYQWAQTHLFDAAELGADPYQTMNAWAGAVPAGSNGLLFFPYLGGERAPLWDSNASGSFIGLTRATDRKQMLRAVLEGITLNLQRVKELTAALVGEPARIQATGGFARSRLWQQIVADCFDQPLTIPDQFESSALGAAIMGWQALGTLPSLQASQDLLHTKKVLQPGPDAAVYQELRPLWQQVGSALAEQYADIAAFARHTQGK